MFTLRTLVDKCVSHSAKGKLYTCFFDFKKAFDSVWHDGLFCKLLHHKIGGKFYDLIKNFTQRLNVLLTVFQAISLRHDMK